MKDKQEKEEEEQVESQKVNPEDYEPKIAGISLKNSPLTVKMGYLVAIFGLFGALIYWGIFLINRCKIISFFQDSSRFWLVINW